MNGKHLIQSIILPILCILATSGNVMGHLPDGTSPPPPGEGWTLFPPLDGAPAFTTSLLEEGSHLLGVEQASRLSATAQHYRTASTVSDPESATYHRQMGDDALIEVLKTIQPDLLLDYRPGATILDPEVPIPSDPVQTSLLLRIIVADGEPAFRLQEINLQQERYHPPHDVRVSNAAETWVLLRLTEVPTDRTVIGFSMTKEGETAPFRWHGLALEAPAPGNLRIDVHDEKGASAPVFMRIQNSATGRMLPVSDYHDLAPVIHDVSGPAENMPPGLSIHGPAGSVMVPVVGPARGFYWLVTPPVEMALPPGDWTIHLLRGLEYVPHAESVSVESGKWTHRTVSMRRWTNMSDKGWHSGDDHVHARLMNSSDARTLLSLAQAMDIRVSNILEMGNGTRTYFIQRGFGGDYRVEQNGHWLVPGQEDPRSMLGHVIGLNTTRMVRDTTRYLELDWIAREVQSTGGLFGQTHVGQNMCEAHRGMAVLVPHDLFDFCSIMQGSLGTELYYDALDLGFQLTASAGSDMPYAGVLGDVRVYAYTGVEKTVDPDEWFRAFRDGATFVTNGPMLDFSVNGRKPGSVIELSANEELSVEATSWGLEGASEPAILELVVNGEVIAQSTDSPTETEPLQLNTMVNAEAGFWIAARATGTNGSRAHTTPVYVSVNGSRHWNQERVPLVIERQMAVLEEIEAVVAGVESAEAKGEINRLDFETLLIARQKETVRALLERSRSLYRDLASVWEEENATGSP